MYVFLMIIDGIKLLLLLLLFIIAGFYVTS